MTQVTLARPIPLSRPLPLKWLGLLADAAQRGRHLLAAWGERRARLREARALQQSLLDLPERTLRDIGVCSDLVARASWQREHEQDVRAMIERARW